MRILIINLARAEERRRIMERRLSGLGLVFERVEAVDGRTLSAAERALADHDVRRRITPYPLSDNEIGCWLSHRRALAQAASSGEPMTAILEDDAELTDDFTRTLSALDARKPEFDFLFLHRKFKKGEKFIRRLQLLPDLGMGYVGPAHMGAIGYVASANGARDFLQFVQRPAHAVDKEMHRFWANGLDIQGLERPVVQHADGGQSFIEETRGQERPAQRARYPEADNFYWRWQRGFTRFKDSLHKRRAWARIAKEGKVS